MVKWCKICFVRLPILLKLCLNNSYLIIQGTVSNQIVTKCVYVCVHLTGMKLTCVNKNSSRVTLLDIENLVTKNSVQFQLKNALRNAKELRTHGKHVPPAVPPSKMDQWSFSRKISGINVKEYPNLASSTPVSQFHFFLYWWTNAMALHSSTLGLENPMDGGAWWAAVQGRKESDMTEWLHFHFSLSCIGEGNGNPLQCSSLENPRDGVTQSWTWLSSNVISNSSS